MSDKKCVRFDVPREGAPMTPPPAPSTSTRDALRDLLGAVCDAHGANPHFPESLVRLGGRVEPAARAALRALAAAPPATTPAPDLAAIRTFISVMRRDDRAGMLNGDAAALSSADRAEAALLSAVEALAAERLPKARCAICREVKELPWRGPDGYVCVRCLGIAHTVALERAKKAESALLAAAAETNLALCREEAQVVHVDADALCARRKAEMDALRAALSREGDGETTTATNGGNDGR